MKIVVTFAFRSEFATWRRISSFERLKTRGVPIYLMRTGGAEVYALITGVGARSVRTELQGLLAKPVDLCVASGLAGSLKNAYPAGTIVVAKAIKAAGVEREIKSDESLLKIADQCGAVVVNSFLTSDTVVNSSAEKSNLGEVADAIEMESYQILSEAERSGARVLAVRAISDTADTDLPIDFNAVIDDRGQIGWVPALYEIAKSPTRLPQVIRFGLMSSRSARNLGHFLDRYIQSLVGRGSSALSIARAETR